MVIKRTTKRIFKLPTGQRISSDHPVREFEKNVKARYSMLLEARLYDDLDLPTLWERDALNRRRGVVAFADRAQSLGISIAELAAFDAKVEDLDKTVWKKAADFYRGLLQSRIFDQTSRVYGGIYHQHRVWSWVEISAISGASRSTLFRRMKAGVDLADLLLRPRAKAADRLISYGGEILTIKSFATENGLTEAHVRTCHAKGLSAEETLRTPQRSRGRPRNRLESDVK